MPYRIDISCPSDDALDRLVTFGALDIAEMNGGLAAILPDGVTPAAAAGALGFARVVVSSAIGRDDGSVWLLNPGTVRLGRVLVAPATATASPGTLRLNDSTAFGTGHHPTTALCAEVLDTELTGAVPCPVLDVGTGTGVLALAALMMGAPQAVGLDIDPDALAAAAGNAQLNNLADRLQLRIGGPEAVEGSWPLVVANVLAAPLIEMAPALVRRVAGQGRLILSGISCSLEAEVRQAYQRRGMRFIRSETRAGWTVLVLHASW